MKKTAVVICHLLVIVLLGPIFHACSSSLPPPSSQGPRLTKRMIAQQKARRLFEYAQQENSDLKWDDCLARKAAQRAENMFKDGYFEHKDPATRRNPAWSMVKACYKCQYAGENLSRGEEPAEFIHRAWMESPRHRKNIEDPRFHLLGVGCYETICVQLFAGF